MVTDTKVVEQLVEMITHEVLAAMLEKQEKANIPQGGYCKFTCAESQCVRTCFDRAGNVVKCRSREAFFHGRRHPPGP